ncbi:amidase family protein [Parerythrobacter jejuensis]|uniref:Amidase n=1 Tax=Parerythrobacter jejuensis TaxID=795812 RepID=A0A845ATM8_9SPHN|nr:amidase family protein [Parerythrobacter jejuensis]MXP32717.1 amidase [Parerythrobacter jejuensis]
MAYPTLTDEPGGIALAAQIGSGALSPLEAVDAAIGRIESGDEAINAVVIRDFDRARDIAKAMDGMDAMPHQPLFGVPMTIKESFAIEGLPSCWGLKEFEGQVAKADSTVVRQLKAAGAIVIGKTNIPPNLADWQSANPVYGRTCNPHDHSRSPGGSSGGSAASVAAGYVPVEYGTDIGGSVRVPAHFCGVWGHKTSWGLISKQGHDHPAMGGVDAHDGALSIAGPITRNADDLALMLELTAGLPLRKRAKPLDQCRFLLLIDHPVSPIDDAVRAPIEAAVENLRNAGVTIDTATDALPDLEGEHASYMRMLNVAMARGMPGPDGQRATATDWFDLLDVQARCELSRANLFESYDFVLAPPANILACPHRDSQLFEGQIAINGVERDAAEGLAWAGIATFPNLPSTVVPVGASDGLPCGMQVIGPRWSDFDCIAAAKAIGARLHS